MYGIIAACWSLEENALASVYRTLLTFFLVKTNPRKKKKKKKKATAVEILSRVCLCLDPLIFFSFHS